MSANFMHIGKFSVNSENRAAFIAIMKDYEAHAKQSGLDHSHVIEDENAPGTFLHVTVWANRDDWVAVEKTEAHQQMHSKRDALLNAPDEHDFVCGTIEI